MTKLLKDSAIDLYTTPASYDALLSYISTFSTTERTAATVCAHMSWNLACSIAREEAGQSDEARPFYQKDIELGDLIRDIVKNEVEPQVRYYVNQEMKMRDRSDHDTMEERFADERSYNDAAYCDNEYVDNAITQALDEHDTSDQSTDFDTIEKRFAVERAISDDRYINTKGVYNVMVQKFEDNPKSWINEDDARSMMVRLLDEHDISEQITDLLEGASISI